MNYRYVEKENKKKTSDKQAPKGADMQSWWENKVVSGHGLVPAPVSSSWLASSRLNIFLASRYLS